MSNSFNKVILLNNQRVKSLMDQIPIRSSVADIGSDHGYLPLSLMRHKKCRAIAVEVRSGPWKQTKRSAARANLDLDVRLGYGLRPVSPGEVRNVVIAGMGGQTIIEIMTDAAKKRRSFPRWVLQPMTNSEELRRQLHEWEMRIDQEWIVEDGNQFYGGMSASFGEPIADGRLTVLYPGMNSAELEFIGRCLLLNPDPKITKYFHWRLQKLLHFHRTLPLDQGRHRWDVSRKIDMWKKVMQWHSQLDM